MLDPIKLNVIIFCATVMVGEGMLLEGNRHENES
jgi:hypothetical protein